MVRKTLFGVIVLAALSVPTVAFAQDDTTANRTTVSVTSPYPGIAVDPGSTANFDLEIDGPEGTVVDVGVDGLPEGWSAIFKGGGATITQTMVPVGGQAATGDLRLSVNVPLDAADGVYKLSATADSERTSASLPLTVRVEPGATGSVTLSPDFPGLSGPTDTTFNFRVTLQNDTPSEVQLELSGEGPGGWDVAARPSGSTQASAVTVAAGASQVVNLEAKPPASADAGIYDVGMTASGAGVEESLTVQIQLVGEPSLLLTTSDQRLNADVSAGGASELPVVVLNTGTAMLTGVAMNATPPTDWKVEFTPEVIDQLAPGASQVVTATITASQQAIAGDYDLGINATADLANDSMNIRTTVNPSGLWGLVGAGVIVLTIVALAAVFRQFGRR